MPYLYENHMGGFFDSYEELSWEETHCEICGDSDWCIGYYETDEERQQLIDSFYSYHYYEDDYEEDKEES
jgi:hypothetical protein